MVTKKQELYKKLKKYIQFWQNMEKVLTYEPHNYIMHLNHKRGVWQVVKKMGRPTTKGEDIPSKFIKNYKLYLDPNNNINVTELARMCNMSRTTVYKYMKLMEEQVEE